MTPLRYARLSAASPKILAIAALLLSTLTLTTHPAQADGFDTLYSAESVCQEVHTFQTGVGDEEINTISIPEGPGPIVAAFVTWIGINDLTPDVVTSPGQADSSLVINGTEIAGVSPDSPAGSQEIATDQYWYAWNADIGPSGANILHGSSSHELSISGWAVGDDHGRNGAEVDVVYDVSPCSEPVDVTILSGVDWIYAGAGKPSSTTVVIPIASTTSEQVETVRLNLWGGEKSTDLCRYSALWMLAGTDTQSDGNQLDLFSPSPGQPAIGINNAVEIVANPFLGPDSTCEHKPNPEPDVPYEEGHLYPDGASSAPYNAAAVRRHSLTSEAEMLSIDVDLRIPAGSSWVALQLESEGEHFGESGAWTASFVTSTVSSETSSSNAVANLPTLADSSLVAETDPVEPTEPVDEDPQSMVETEVLGETISNNNATANQIVDDSAAASSSTSDSQPSILEASSSTGAAETLALTGTSTLVLLGAATAMIFAGLLLVSQRRKEAVEPLESSF